MGAEARRLRILVVTRSYPAPGDLYKYPFVHRRVLAYLAAGHEVSVFRPSDRPGGHRFDGVVCLAGERDDLSAHAQVWRPDVIAVHGFSEAIWPLVEPLAGRFPIRAWLHGSEIPAIARFKAQHDGGEEDRSEALRQLDRRCAFWRRFLASPPANFGLVFVSESAASQAREDMGDLLGNWAIIHNPIDTELFEYQPKAANDRFNVLMIRPFDSYGYGNDLAVSAIASLSSRAGFDRLQFQVVGDGPLFEATLQPIRHLPNVRLERRFLTQAQIADLHGQHGMFLVPTRIDTQGVSRDEAMASGLVPITNLAGAVGEFVDSDCAALAPANDAGALAEGLWEMVEDAGLFARRSAAAAERVRRQSCGKLVIPRELALLGEAANG
jgi:glycosyltransferase involved in cell wall biosynthesis